MGGEGIRVQEQDSDSSGEDGLSSGKSERPGKGDKGFEQSSAKARGRQVRDREPKVFLRKSLITKENFEEEGIRFRRESERDWQNGKRIGSFLTNE